MPIVQTGRSTERGVIPRSPGWEQFGEGAFVRLTGFEATRRLLDSRIAACRAAQGLRVVIGSTVPYAPFVNWGTKYILGRFFLQVGQAAASTSIRRNLPAALATGPAEVLAVFNEAGKAAIAAMFPITPVRTGRLRREQVTRLYGSRG